jgi:hypothetical protein
VVAPYQTLVAPACGRRRPYASRVRQRVVVPTATPSDRLARLAQLGPGPWSRDALLALGWSRRQVERDVESGRLVRVRRGLYRPAGADPDWTSPRAYAAFVSAAPGSVVSHESAQRVAGLWLPLGADERVHLTTENRPLPSDRVVRRHRAALPAHDVVVRDGVPFTTEVRTAVDLALGLPLPRALQSLDCAVRFLALGEAWCTPAGRALLSSRSGADRHGQARDALALAVSRAVGRHGHRCLAAALPWVHASSESPYESWSRGVLVGAGIVPEAVGLAVHGASGRRYFADLAWPSARVLAEVDGLTKYGSDLRTVRERLAAERHRQTDLEDAGWLVVRWTAGEGSELVVARVSRALAAAAG